MNAHDIVAILLDEKVRDDTKSLPIPDSGKAYARLRGKRGTDAQRKTRLYKRMVADLVNGGRLDFKNRQVASNPTFAGKV
jgi:hypothetical protein